MVKGNMRAFKIGFACCAVIRILTGVASGLGWFLAVLIDLTLAANILSRCRHTNLILFARRIIIALSASPGIK
jgi:hypothetical protein